MIKVLIVDDQQLVRSGFTAILNSQEDIEVVAEASDGGEAVHLASTLSPDVICMDIEMPKMNGIEATTRIREHHRSATGGRMPKILILTTFGQEGYIRDAITAGVDGFLVKTCGVDELLGAVRRTARGGLVLGVEATRIVMSAMGRCERGSAPIPTHNGHSVAPQLRLRTTGEGDSGACVLSDNLKETGVTDREKQILLLVVTGCSNAEIADQLFLGESTVKTHVSNLLDKLHARDRTHLVIWAYNHGYVADTEGQQPRL